MSSGSSSNADRETTADMDEEIEQVAENLDEVELFLKREMLLKELGCLNGDNDENMSSFENNDPETLLATTSSTIDNSVAASPTNFSNFQQQNESSLLKTPEIDDVERNNFNTSENVVVDDQEAILQKTKDNLCDESVNPETPIVEQPANAEEIDVDEDEEYESEGDLDVEAYDLLEKDCEEKKKLEETKKFEDCGVKPLVWKKTVLKRRAVENFEILPENWIEITHASGMPVYLHRQTRVCTVSRPYLLGPANVRRHYVPLAAIPCLHQTRLKEEEIARKKEIIENGLKNPDDPLTKLKTAGVKVEGANDKRRYLNLHEFREYCAKKFDFETVNIVRFRSWLDHRKFHRKRKHDSMIQNAAVSPLESADADVTANNEDFKRPMLPSDTKIITIPNFNRGRPGRQFLLNPRGKTTIALLHEYVQKVLKGQVAYEFSETRNAANPYMAKAKILPVESAKNCASKKAKNGAQKTADQPGTSNGIEASAEEWVAVGVGHGNSKRNAKTAAARDALRILLPDLDLSVCTDAKQIDQSSSSIIMNNNAIENGDPNSTNQNGAPGCSYSVAKVDESDLDLFDTVSITDPRVHEMSIKAGQPAPFVILQECLKRNAAFGDTTIEMDIKRINHHRHEYTMTVGKGRHEVKVRCLNKKDGKQRASQFMLQKLQPQAKTWGALVRLYGYSAQQKLRENRRQKDDVIKLHAQHLLEANNGHNSRIISTNNEDLDANNQINNYRDLEPNMAILSKLRKEMKKLYKDEKLDETNNVEKPAKCPKMIDL